MRHIHNKIKLQPLSLLVLLIITGLAVIFWQHSPAVMRAHGVSVLNQHYLEECPFNKEESEIYENKRCYEKMRIT